MIYYHMIGFGMGFILDLILGDPSNLPHPVRLMGLLITKLEKQLLEGNASDSLTDKHKKIRGRILVFLVLAATGIASLFLLSFAYVLHPLLGVIVESIMTYQILATKCLRLESMKVYNELKHNNPEGARYAVSMIVGRDTKDLDEIGMTKAAVETVAENCSDGVIAPMLFLAIGGPVLGFLYKAVNTMDSMVGYKNSKYLYFGRAAAKLDDVVNYLPSRISAGLMIMAAFLPGKEFDPKQAFFIYKRDRYKHESPNSAQTESACAGALGIQLAGDGVYSGKIVSKPLIGDALRPVEFEDIVSAGRLLYRTAFLCEGICLIIMFFVGRIYR